MITEIQKITDESVKLAAKILRDGGIIGMPTETVYGLAAAGTISEAVKQVFAVKGRPNDNPLIAHVHKDYDIEKLVEVERDYVYKLKKLFTPGPLTLVMKSRGVVCEEATCGGDTLAVRIPSHEGCQKLLKEVNLPIVAPSANLSKHTSPVTAEHVFNDLNGKIPLILDGGRCSGGIESTVLDVTGDVPRILRAGLITKEMIENAVGACVVAEHKTGDKVKSPGVKYTHYKPRCDTCLYSEEEIEKALIRYEAEKSAGRTPYIMCRNAVAELFDGKNILSLGNTEEEIAASLYAALLDGEKKADIIIAIDMPSEKGVYLGITNRLRKSCG